jgi:hypothetical protein
MRQMRDGARALERQEAFLETLGEGDRLMRRGIVALCCSIGLPSARPSDEPEAPLEAAAD